MLVLPVFVGCGPISQLRLVGGAWLLCSKIAFGIATSPYERAAADLPSAYWTAHFLVLSSIHFFAARKNSANYRLPF
jgi:hypothetical protein